MAAVEDITEGTDDADADELRALVTLQAERIRELETALAQCTRRNTRLRDGLRYYKPRGSS